MLAVLAGIAVLVVRCRRRDRLIAFMPLVPIGVRARGGECTDDAAGVSWMDRGRPDRRDRPRQSQGTAGVALDRTDLQAAGSLALYPAILPVALLVISSGSLGEPPRHRRIDAPPLRWQPRREPPSHQIRYALFRSYVLLASRALEHMSEQIRAQFPRSGPQRIGEVTYELYRMSAFPTPMVDVWYGNAAIWIQIAHQGGPGDPARPRPDHHLNQVPLVAGPSRPAHCLRPEARW